MTFPPITFEQLREVSLMIKHGEIELPLGKKSKQALFKMVEDPESTALCNIVELSEKIDISPASLTRLAKLLGFTGFNPFHQLFKKINNTPNHFYSDNAQSILENENKTAKDILREQLEQTYNDISNCIENLDNEELEQAANLLTQQRRVFVFGYRQSSAIASTFRYGLSLLRNNVQMLVQSDHGVAVALSQLRKEDLLVVIGAAPHSSITLKVAAIAKEKQCKIIAITDSQLSPLTDSSTIALHFQSSGQFYINSQVSSCFLVENLLSITAKRLGNAAVENLKQYELLVSKLQLNN